MQCIVDKACRSVAAAHNGVTGMIDEVKVVLKDHFTILGNDDQERMSFLFQELIKESPEAEFVFS